MNKDVLREEPPVDGPLEQEDSTQIKCTLNCKNRISIFGILPLRSGSSDGSPVFGGIRNDHSMQSDWLSFLTSTNKISSLNAFSVVTVVSHEFVNGVKKMTELFQ